MSDRTKRILSLAKENILEDTDNDNATSWKTTVYDEDTEWDPVSNWVIEVDPEVLKNEQMNHEQDKVNILSNVGRAISESDQVDILKATTCSSTQIRNGLSSFPDVNNIGQVSEMYSSCAKNFH
ncbi:hypothetical protein WA026_011737 [Henosepilachna vigintioctopunctata]|uniref:Uncharacterized protein n=1 Tax=Henosepilachna vigintioctopunctata TaxID=420089 RepID=A0AAW1TRW3_9CUCU